MGKRGNLPYPVGWLGVGAVCLVLGANRCEKRGCGSRYAYSVGISGPIFLLVSGFSWLS